MIDEALEYVKSLLEKYNITSENWYYYHNWFHTKSVFDEATKLADKYNLSPEEKEILQLAAIFHDTGFIKSYDNNEPIGAEIAEEWLTSKWYDKDKIALIKKLILATQYTYKPQTLLEELMKMSDFSNVYNGEFFEKGDDLRKELEVLKNETFTDQEWLSRQKNLISYLLSITNKETENYKKLLILQDQIDKKLKAL